MNPAKGIRAFPLENDELCRRAGRVKVPIQGKILLKVTAIKTDKKTMKPIAWRLDITRCQNLSPATRKLSNPYCEILWRGPAEKYTANLLCLRWIGVGQTKVKERCTDPLYTKTDDSIFDLPPVWTDNPIDGRGPFLVTLKKGGWVARNCIPPAKIEEDVNQKRVAVAYSAQDADAIMRLNIEKMEFHKNSALLKESNLRVEMIRLLWLQQEEERCAMAVEEKFMRDYSMAYETERCAASVETQKLFSRQFQRIMGNIQNPPTILARARFMMGEALDSGGLKLVCQDPSTNKIMTIITIAILYPEDEQEMSRHLVKLIGNQHPNIHKVISFSAHQIRGYTFDGQASTNDRMGIVILERLEGMTVMNYIKEYADGDNDAFRHLLRLVLRGLQCLHEVGFVHRNVHTEAMLVIASNDFLNSRKGSRLKFTRRPGCRIGEYWLLQNPRKAGCEYSLGRADWGERATMPPEVLKGRVDAKSDVYAFGMCVYYWATFGESLTYRHPTTALAVETIKSHIPLKWGKWVHTLLRMCLQPNPDLRCTAAEAVDFLSRNHQ